MNEIVSKKEKNNFNKKLLKLNKEKYSSIVSEFQRNKIFSKKIKIFKKDSFNKLLNFMGFKDLANIVNNDFLKLHKKILKITHYEENHKIEFIQISDSFILKTLLENKANKIVFKNIIKNNSPITKNSIVGSVDKKFFKNEFLKKYKIIKKYINNI